MRCVDVRERLHAEGAKSGGKTSLPFLAHLAGCASCRAHWRQARDFDHALRNLPPPVAPATLRSRVMERIEGVTIAPSSPSEKGKRIMLNRLVISGAAVTAAIALGVLAGPRFAGRPSVAAEIRTALQNVQTWHFVGWRLKEGKQVRWEIWGRRDPYFYREQFGNDILVDDGRYRYRVLPPEYIARPRGMALKTASAQALSAHKSALSNPLAPFMEASKGDFLANLYETSRSDGKIQFRNGNSYTGRRMDRILVEVSADTKLPVRYELRYTLFKEKADQEYIRPTMPNETEKEGIAAMLEAAYNQPLPPDVADIAAPPGYTVADMTKPVTEPAASNEGSNTQNGLTVRGAALTQDAAGNLRLRFHAWLGDTKVERDNPPVDLNLRNDITNVVAQDDRGKIYLAIGFPLKSWTPNAPESYFVPLEPFTPQTPLARSLTLTNWEARVSTSEWQQENQSTRGVDLLKERMQLTIPLPRNVSDLDFDTVKPEEGLGVGPGSARPTLASEAAQARAFFYERRVSRDARTQNSTRDAVKQDVQNAIKWREASIQEAIRIGDKQIQEASKINLRWSKEQWELLESGKPLRQ